MSHQPFLVFTLKLKGSGREQSAVARGLQCVSEQHWNPQKPLTTTPMSPRLSWLNHDNGCVLCKKKKAAQHNCIFIKQGREMYYNCDLFCRKKRGYNLVFDRLHVTLSQYNIFYWHWGTIHQHSKDWHSSKALSKYERQLWLIQRTDNINNLRTAPFWLHFLLVFPFFMFSGYLEEITIIPSEVLLSLSVWQRG